MIKGINHLTLSVKNLEQSFIFYRDILGLKPIARWPRGCYFMASDLWLTLILDSHVRENTLPEYTHVAFTVLQPDFAAMSQRIIAADCPIFQENTSEGDSLYFIEPNGHKLEIHASDPETRIKTAKENPWEGLEFFV